MIFLISIGKSGQKKWKIHTVILLFPSRLKDGRIMKCCMGQVRNGSLYDAYTNLAHKLPYTVHIYTQNKESLKCYFSVSQSTFLCIIHFIIAI